MIAFAALAAAGTLRRAAARYRVLAVAFGGATLVGPLALVASALRPAASPGVALPVGWGASPLLALAAAWAAALLVELLLDVRRLRAVKKRARPIGAVAVRAARLALSAEVASPTAIGYRHPAIVVPADFRERVDAAEWDAVVAHESAHLARADDWAKAVQSIVLRACWWLPGLWMLSQALDLERELASDERAAMASGARHFAACLLRLATHPAGAGVAPALWGRRSQVAIRVEQLLRPRAVPSPVARAAVSGAASALVLAAVVGACIAVPPAGRPAQSAGPARLAAAPARRPPAHRSRRLVAGPAAPPERVVIVLQDPEPSRTRIRSRQPRRIEVVAGPIRIAILPGDGPIARRRGLPLPEFDSVRPAPGAPAVPADVTVATGSGPASGGLGLLTIELPSAQAAP